MKKNILFIVVLIGLLSNTIFAMTLTWQNEAKFNRSVSNAYYYVDSSASSYTYQINDAIDNWIDTGYGWNPIYIYPVSSNYATHIDFYKMSYSQDSILDSNTGAYTSFWDIYENPITSLGSAPYSNYFYTEVRINSSINLPTKGIKHEIGHCFGLNHYDNNNYSIMFPYLDGMAVSTVQQCDHDTINYLYN